jgi:multisubunit Na+/H+ antiporter MnhE subunit
MKTIWQDIVENKEVILVLSFIWMMLFESFSIPILISAVFVSILVVIFTDRFLLKGNYEHSYIIGLGTLFKYTVRLVIEIYLAGIGVIPTIIRGNEEVEIVRTETKLTDELLIDILANSITLTPGTVTIEKKGNQLLVLNLNALEKEENTRAVIPLKLEKILLDYEEKTEGKA